MEAMKLSILNLLIAVSTSSEYYFWGFPYLRTMTIAVKHGTLHGKQIYDIEKLTYLDE